MHLAGKLTPDIDMYTLSELGMLEILNLKSSELSEYFTVSADVMEYRSKTFMDMIENPRLTSTLNKLVPILTDITELRRLEADSRDSEDYLSSITEIELYIACIETLNNGLSEVHDNLKSPAFIALDKRISELVESDYYKER